MFCMKGDCEAFPMAAAGLLSDKPAEKAASLEYWKALAKDWKEITESRFPRVKCLAERSLA